MALNCKTIDSSNQCLEWVVVQPSMLPELTLVQGNAIGFACLMVLATVYVIKMCIKTLK